MTEEYVNRCVTVRKDQDEWLKKSTLNFCKFIREKLDLEMKGEDHER